MVGLTCYIPADGDGIGIAVKEPVLALQMQAQMRSIILIRRWRSISALVAVVPGAACARSPRARGAVAGYVAHGIHKVAIRVCGTDIPPDVVIVGSTVNTVRPGRGATGGATGIVIPGAHTPTLAQTAS